MNLYEILSEDEIAHLEGLRKTDAVVSKLMGALDRKVDPTEFFQEQVRMAAIMIGVDLQLFFNQHVSLPEYKHVEKPVLLNAKDKNFERVMLILEKSGKIIEAMNEKKGASTPGDKARTKKELEDDNLIPRSISS